MLSETFWSFLYLVAWGRPGGGGRTMFSALQNTLGWSSDSSSRTQKYLRFSGGGDGGEETSIENSPEFCSRSKRLPRQS